VDASLDAHLSTEVLDVELPGFGADTPIAKLLQWLGDLATTDPG
jgi:hypothetical protein